MDEIEKILSKLDQEERLELLERLIKGAAQAKEESLTVEQRLERLEDQLGGAAAPVVKTVRLGSCGCCG